MREKPSSTSLFTDWRVNSVTFHMTLTTLCPHTSGPPCAFPQCGARRRAEMNAFSCHTTAPYSAVGGDFEGLFFVPSFRRLQLTVMLRARFDSLPGLG